MFRIANIMAKFKARNVFSMQFKVRKSYLKINVKTVLEASLLVSDRVPLCSLMI